MRWFHFILSHSIFISICAWALSLQTYLLLDIPADHITGLLVFSATLSSYNLYWLISKFHFTKKREPLQFLKINFSNFFLFLLASSGVLVCIYLRPDTIPQVAVAVLLTLLYSLPLWPFPSLHFLRKAGFIKTILLAFTWAYVTIMLPVQGSFFEITKGIAILFIARFSFMLMLCTIFDSRDIAVDKIHALRSLATDVSRVRLKWIMMILFGVYMTAGFFLRITFNTNAQVIALLITGIATMIVYRLSLKRQGYIFYYFIVDGLMLFSSITTIMAGN